MVQIICERRFHSGHFKAHFLYAVQHDLTVYHREIPDNQVIILVAVRHQQIPLFRIEVQAVIVEILLSCIRDVPVQRIFRFADIFQVYIAVMIECVIGFHVFCHIALPRFLCFALNIPMKLCRCPEEFADLFPAVCNTERMR